MPRAFAHFAARSPQANHRWALSQRLHTWRCRSLQPVAANYSVKWPLRIGTVSSCISWQRPLTSSVRRHRAQRNCAARTRSRTPAFASLSASQACLLHACPVAGGALLGSKRDRMESARVAGRLLLLGAVAALPSRRYRSCQCFRASRRLTIRSSGPLRIGTVSSCNSWQRPLTSSVRCLLGEQGQICAPSNLLCCHRVSRGRLLHALGG